MKPRKFHIQVEAARALDPQFKLVEYQVFAKTREGAERKALALAKKHWHAARLPEDRLH